MMLAFGCYFCFVQIFLFILICITMCILYEYAILCMYIYIFTYNVYISLRKYITHLPTDIIVYFSIYILYSLYIYIYIIKQQKQTNLHDYCIYVVAVFQFILNYIRKKITKISETTDISRQNIYYFTCYIHRIIN